MAKRRKKTLLSKLHIKADKSISLWVRARTKEEYGKCPLCEDGVSRPVQACFHFIRRRRKILRWDIRNLIGSCHRCNYLEYRNPDPSRAWLIRFGGVDNYLGLVDISKKSFEPTVEYLEEIIKRYSL